jgi:hypothetical protein
MELQEIEVVIGPDGTTRIEVRGVAGPSCLELTADLEKALGGEVLERERTAEAQQAPGVPVEEHLRQHG